MEADEREATGAAGATLDPPPPSLPAATGSSLSTTPPRGDDSLRWQVAEKDEEEAADANSMEEATVDPLHTFVASHADAEFLPMGEPWAIQPPPYPFPAAVEPSHHEPSHCTYGHGHSHSSLLLPTVEPHAATRGEHPQRKRAMQAVERCINDAEAAAQMAATAKDGDADTCASALEPGYFGL